jgi:Flp pilus assembly protein CpaB
MIRVILSISLIAVLLLTAFAGYFVSTPALAKASNDPSNSKTVKVKCRNVAVALATLDVAIGLADKDSLDASLNEGNISPDLQSERHLLVDLTQQVRDSCHSFSDILQGLNFR